jgi:ISXO2-like transposase domain
MAQHFLLSSAARPLSLAKVARMSDEEAYDAFRLAEIGTHHHISGRYLSTYASEMAWREDNRRVSNGELYLMAADAALKHAVSC